MIINIILCSPFNQLLFSTHPKKILFSFQRRKILSKVPAYIFQKYALAHHLRSFKMNKVYPGPDHTWSHASSEATPNLASCF
jgi:hypothetical protein